MTQEDFPKNAKDFFSYAKKNQAEMVDLKFVDMLGSWQHCSFPVDTLDEGSFEEGLGLSKSPKAKRLEFRCPDPSCNGYLAWSAMLMAMIDGIQNKVDPGKPLDRDIYEMTRHEMKEMGIRTTPGSLEEAVNALETDHAFLLRGDVFTVDLIQTWIDWKRSKELDPIRLRPHPHEFSLYYDN
jgi:glutamine synthetase